MSKHLHYDDTNPKSIENFARQLMGHTFKDIVDGFGDSYDMGKDAFRTAESRQAYNSKARKGGLGNLVEELYFGYKANSDSSADFQKAGVELKVTPYEKTKKGKLRAGERLVLTMISYTDPVESDFYKSHLWQKCRLILLMYYLRDKSLEDNLEYQIDFVRLFTPPPEDLKIIEDDYNLITKKIAEGRANELSESDTMYLGACTKGSTAEKSTVPQAYYNPSVLARKRAFCYKNSYMTSVLNNYIAKDIATYVPFGKLDEDDEAIIKDAEELKNQSFAELVIRKINAYKGMSDVDLCQMFNVQYDASNKALWITLAYRMLGIKSNRASEFVKANIAVKAISLEEKGGIRENSPLPTFKFKELAKEGWEESTLFNYLYETKFLYVVFQKVSGMRILKGCQLWNMPYDLLDGTVKEEWERASKVVRDGVELIRKPNGKVENNLLKSKETKIIHIRPHSAKSYYVFGDGSTYGSGSIKDADELPDGRFMTKQSFWLNAKFVYSILDDNLK